MTITPPTVGPIDTSLITSAFRANTDVVPLAYREAETVTAMLERLMRWTVFNLIPYLNTNFEDIQESWIDNVTNFVDVINQGLNEQTADNAAKISQALTDIANSSVTITDPAMLAALEAAQSQTLAWLDGRYNANAVSDQHVHDVIAAGTITTGYLSTLYGDKASVDLAKTYVAPPPSGGDDTAVLQALVNAAQSTNGTVVLQHGTYLANLLTSGSVQQPRILGQGRDQTFLQGFTSATPVLKMKGGSGTLNGGFLADFTINAASTGGGIGLELSGVCGVKWQRLRFAGTLALALHFYNEAAGDFTEFCSGDAVFRTSVVQPVQYSRAAGNESFHGSGLTKGSVIQQGATTSLNLIIIDNNCFPYGAPLECTVFLNNPATNIISNRSTSRNASFQGNLDVETASGVSSSFLGDPVNNITFFEGNIAALQAGAAMKFGNLQVVDSVYYIGSSTYTIRRPWRTNTPLGTGTTNLFVDRPKTALLHVEIVGSGYNYAYLLQCWANTYDSTGSVTILATNRTLNTAGWGAPTFGWANNLPTITNPLYPASGVTAYITVIPMENPRADDRFAQH